MTYNKISDIPFTAYLFWFAVGGGIFLYYSIETTIAKFSPANPTYFSLATLFYSGITSVLLATIAILLHLKKINSRNLLVKLFISTFMGTIFFSVGAILYSNWIFSEKNEQKKNLTIISKNLASHAAGGKLIVSPWRFILADKNNKKIEVGVNTRLYQLSEINEKITILTFQGALFGRYVINYEKYQSD